ncbi:MAG: peptidase C1 [Xanthomonadales bacterium]|nr:peptidase C1 [Gammaproteobacteria bacterium]MBT8054041.1 peptidase C1 [Gammaproteobacteria bacterium]NND57428.1 peptidase C1 [Xanthomonadales bacterium]NNK50357.1 peptidase C1 [Xanthomonadales bacterium]
MAKKKVWTEKYSLTAREDAPDFRDFFYQPALVKLPARRAIPKDLIIRDQGKEGACTGYGLAAVIDLQIGVNRRKNNHKEKRTSARMLYEMAKRYDEWSGEGYTGSSCRGAIKGWYNMGVCRHKFYPDHGTADAGFTVAAAKDARNNTIGAYYRLSNRISDYHAAMAEVGAIFCSARIHPGWDEVDSKPGKIPLRNKALGSHAFAIVGYDEKGFWIQNSWGEKWGKDGTALWTYEDWLANVQDAWVFRMAVPTPQIWHLPSRINSNTEMAESAPKPTRAEIAGHFVHFDDGKFHENGRYWSTLDDVKLTADLVAESSDYDHLLLYAHGGLNSPAASARRIAAMKETFKDNRIYPYHIMYDTGLLEELKDVLVGRRKQAEERAGGFTDWLDRLVEIATRVPGRALWREMKFGAEKPFSEEESAGSQALAAFIDAFNRSDKPKRIHLAGHSTGMILQTHVLQRLSVLTPGTCIDTVSMLAPAGSVELYMKKILPFLKAQDPQFRIDEMEVYNLSDALEQDDEVTKAYNKSLLYLVSRAFEESVPQKLLGMQTGCKDLDPEDKPRLKFHYSKGDLPRAQVTKADSHGGFDNDPVTMNHILRRILPNDQWAGAVRFTKETLDY